MPSLLELVERVNKGELIDPALLEVYQESANAAEKFLACHAHAQLTLRRSHQSLLGALEAIDYADQKVLGQYVNVCGLAGLADQRTAPVVKFGASAITRREYALGVEAVQNGVTADLANGGAWLADRENCLFVASQYDRAAQAIGWSPAGETGFENKQPRVAYVTTMLADDEPAARFATNLAKQFDGRRFKLFVYTTEAGCRRERVQFAPASYAATSAKRGRETIETLKTRKAPCWHAPLDGDLTNAARELANQLVKDQIDVVIFDATQADAVAAMVAGWDVAKVKLNLARRTPLYAAVDAVCYLDAARHEADRDFWSRRGTDAKLVLDGIDADDVNASPAPQRGSYGIPEQSIVLATSGTDLDRTVGEEFVDAIIQLLRAHPTAVYLLIGDGELSWQKRRFETAGVAKRVGFAGKRKDLPGFLRIADIYVAEYPVASPAGVLGAMAAERPVVAMKWSDAPEHAPAATFVGDDAIAARDTATFVERVGKLIKDAPARAKLGKSLRARLDQQFSFAQTAKQLEQTIEHYLARRTQSIAPAGDAALAEAA
jgi:glycosyltransferase involved in cell wall biosynthesis